METGRGNNYHKVIIMLHIIRKKHTNFIKVFNYYHIHLAKKKKNNINIFWEKGEKFGFVDNYDFTPQVFFYFLKI